MESENQKLSLEELKQTETALLDSAKKHFTDQFVYLRLSLFLFPSLYCTEPLSET